MLRTWLECRLYPLTCTRETISIGYIGAAGTAPEAHAIGFIPHPHPGFSIGRVLSVRFHPLAVMNFLGRN